MTITLTPEQLAAMEPCGLTDRLAMFGRRKSMGVKQALAAGATVRDILWVAGRLGLKDKCVRFALLAAQRAVRPDSDPRVQACLDAVNSYVADPTATNLKELQAARSAAAAVAAATVAAAAYAAADAATTTAAVAAAAAAAYAAVAAAAARKQEIEAQHALLVEVFG